MTGGRRYGLGGKEDIGGGFFGFCFNFGRRGGYCLACSLELGTVQLIGSFGASMDLLMVDEKSRILARANEDHKVLTGQMGQTVQ